jgi:hypothetical protein
MEAYVVGTIVTPRGPIATIISHPHNGNLYVSAGLWNHAPTGIEYNPYEFRRATDADLKAVRKHWGNWAVPQYPGEYTDARSEDHFGVYSAK